MAEEKDKTTETTENAVDKKIEARENLGVIDDIKKTINEIRQGVRSNIASLWQGFKNILSKGFAKFFGTDEKLAEAPQSQESKSAEAPASETSKSADNADDKSAKPAATDSSKPETSAEKPKLEESATFKKVIETFTGETKAPVKNVLYPASGYESINDSFKDAKITYVDIDEAAVNAHKEAGHTAVKEDMENYKPEEKPDLTVLLNPHAKSDKINKLLAHVPKDKHVICNNYHSTAELLNKDSNFELIGVINPEGKTMDKEKLTDYFKEVETDEEFKAKDEMQYNKAVALIKEKNGDTSKDILKQYKELTKNDTSGLHRIPFKKGGDAAGFQTWYYVFKRIKEPAAGASTGADAGGQTSNSGSTPGSNTAPPPNTSSGGQSPSSPAQQAA